MVCVQPAFPNEGLSENAVVREQEKTLWRGGGEGNIGEEHFEGASPEERRGSRVNEGRIRKAPLQKDRQ